MGTVIIANPRAAAGRVGKRWERYQRDIVACVGEAEARHTTAMGDATRLTREALLDGAERIVAVGGDGTINEVINGFFGEDGKKLGDDPVLAVFPAGTGGDFVRSLGLSGVDLVPALQGATERAIDVGRASYTTDAGEQSRHFINISSFGSSGLIVDKVNKSTKLLGGKTSFYLGTVRGMLAYKNQRIRLRIDDHFDEEVVVNTVAVANGRFFGGSMMIAPEAKVDDGQFDVTIVGDISAAKFVRYSGRVYKGQTLQLPGISGERGKVVIAEPLGEAPLLIDLDGEQPGRLPVRYEILPGALRVLAPWNDAVAAS